MLIGSQSINMIALKNDYSIFSRKADAKIARLREVIEKIQRGEEVDVEKVLGTGDEAQEQEWKDGQSIFTPSTLASIAALLRYCLAVLSHIEKEDRLWQSKIRRRERRAARKAEQEEAAKGLQNTEEEYAQTQGAVNDESPDQLVKVAKPQRGFY